MKTYKVQFTSNGYNHGALPITSIEIELYETLKEKNEREN